MPLLFNIVLEVLVMVTREGKEIERVQLGKEEAKLLLCADDMILDIENLKRCYQKTTRTHHEFGKVAGYKINT